MHDLFRALLITFGILLLFFGWLFYRIMDDGCGHTIYAELASPDNRYKAIVFERNCGATTDFSTQISILPMTETLPNESGNIFVIAGHPDVHRVKLKWLSNTEISIRRKDIGFAVKPEKSVEFIEGIKVSYQVDDSERVHGML